MQLFQFGKTDLQVTRLGLGLAALGRPGYINLGHGEDFKDGSSIQSMNTQTQTMLDFAYHRGIRYFDVARSYGFGEKFLGQWLSDRYTDLSIGSKWGYTYTADWQIEAEFHEIKEHTLPVLDRQWKESLEELGRKPSIYHIHSATLESGVLDKSEVLDYLWQLKEKDVIVGLSLSGTGQADTLARALEIKVGEEHLFGSVQATYNILERSVEPQLIQASEAGWGIIIKEAVANGRLTQRNYNATGAAYDLIRDLSDRYECNLDTIAMAYILDKPWVSVVLSGASTIEQLESNLKSLQLILSPEDIEMLNEVYESPDKYWADRSKLSWN